MQKAEKKFSLILKRLKNSNISPEEIANLNVAEQLFSANKTQYFKYSHCWIILAVIFVIVITTFTNKSDCFLEMPIDSTKIFRKPEDCSICANFSKIDKIKNITSANFEQQYSSKAKPVVIADGTRGWPANDVFSFEFFKKLYQQSDKEEKFACQFFPYQTEFKTLNEALDMSAERAQLLEGEKPWYIGWSNCNDEAGKILRNYYSRPYFLPNTSENMALNWIFMGGPGFGAHLHVDNVQYPSWQAQINGRKKWRLVPPPECFYVCQEVEVVVEPGEIIVVDTNRWYHQTLVLPGGISITIGSEFD